MRTALLAAAALLVAAPTAFAAPRPADPPAVSVVVGPKLQEKARTTYGVVEVNRLADQFRDSVARALVRKGAYPDGRVELTLVDATPNRPTMKQMTDKPGLSYESFGNGGATIEGRAIAADGTVTPVKYSYYETDIRFAAYASQWQDAQRAFGTVAYRLARGEEVAAR